MRVQPVLASSEGDSLINMTHSTGPRPGLSNSVMMFIPRDYRIGGSLGCVEFSHPRE